MLQGQGQARHSEQPDADGPGEEQDKGPAKGEKKDKGGGIVMVTVGGQAEATDGGGGGCQQFSLCVAGRAKMENQPAASEGGQAGGKKGEGMAVAAINKEKE